jgi:isopenicillin-N epimerase
MADNNLWGEDWPDVRRQWDLDLSVAFLNHGSFGACPLPVLQAQAEWRAEMEGQPVEFLERAPAFLRADPGGLAFVPNATMAVAAVLANVELQPGDQILITDHAYPAVRNAADRACALRGATLVVQHVPLPLPAPDDIAAAILASVTRGTRLVIVDHVTSPTAAIFPIESVVRGCHDRDVPVLVDSAHGPGMLDIDVDTLAPDFWTGNFHKWVCAPKGSAALFVGAEHRGGFRPLITSHGYGSGFHPEFDWVGTADPTPYLSLSAALDFMDELGWERTHAHNHALVVEGRTLARAAVETVPPTPDDAVGSMAILALPTGVGATPDEARALQTRLYREQRIEVPFVAWNGTGHIRLSAQVYNHPAEYSRLADALETLLDADRLEAEPKGPAIQSRSTSL